MVDLEQYPKTFTKMEKRLRDILSRVPGVDLQERDDLAWTINDLADKACDIVEVFQHLIQEPTTDGELGDLLIAIQLTVEQIRGHCTSNAFDGKLYEIGDRLKGVEPSAADSESLTPSAD